MNICGLILPLSLSCNDRSFGGPLENNVYGGPSNRQKEEYTDSSEDAGTKEWESQNCVGIFFDRQTSQKLDKFSFREDQIHPVINFSNILLAAIVVMLFCQKITKPNFKQGKALKTLLFQKAFCKMLVKLTSTPTINFSFYAHSSKKI